MKFIFLNGGEDDHLIKKNLEDKIGKYLIFNRNGWFIGKLIEAMTPDDWTNCRFMFEDVHHLKGNFVSIVSSFENLKYEHDRYIFITPSHKKWEEVISERLTDEKEMIAIKIISEIAYNESMESMFIRKENNAISIDELMDKLSKTYEVDLTII